MAKVVDALAVTLDPEAIVLAGGLPLAGKVVVEPLRAMFAEWPGRRPAVVVSEFITFGGAYGALARLTLDQPKPDGLEVSLVRNFALTRGV